MADTLQGRAPGATNLYANAAAPTPSDIVDDPAGTSQGIVCTGAAGNVKVTLAGGGVVTVPISVGWPGAPLRVQRVWATGTTATGLLLLFV